MSWNPFDLTAVPFLTLYLALVAALFTYAFHLRANLGPATAPPHPLTTFELAYLAGGASRLGDTILLCLLSSKGARISSTGKDINVLDQASLSKEMSHPAAISFPANMTRQEFQTAIDPLVRQLSRRLKSLGYIATDDQLHPFRVMFLPASLALLLFGFARVILGLQRHHPVGILVVLLVFTLIAVLVLLANEPVRTRAGEQAYAASRAAYVRASRAPLQNELMIAVALSGAVVLAGTDFSPVYAASKQSDGGSGGGGDGGDGCGGGCGGCGG